MTEPTLFELPEIEEGTPAALTRPEEARVLKPALFGSLSCRVVSIVGMDVSTPRPFRNAKRSRNLDADGLRVKFAAEI